MLHWHNGIETIFVQLVKNLLPFHKEIQMHYDCNLGYETICQLLLELQGCPGHRSE